MADFKVDGNKVAEAISLLTAVYNNPDEKLYTKAKNLLATAAQSNNRVVAQRADKLSTQEVDFYSTGEDWLDDWIGGGVRKQEVALIGGIPYIGKTHWLVWLGSRLLRQGATVAHYNGEDIITDVQDYYLQAAGKKAMKNLWLVDMQDYHFSAQQSEETIEDLNKQKHKPDVVVVDHVDIMQSSNRSHADWEDATGVIRELKILSKRQDLIIIAGSQLHEKSRERRGMRRFYRASIGKQANADIILMVEDVMDNEYNIVREKARGRKVKNDTKAKVFEVDWDKMTVEDVTEDG